jgi:hypothetical protein
MNYIFLIIAIIISVLVAQFVGAKRKIGFWWTLFFCTFLTPLIGVIIALFSKKLGAPIPSPSKLKVGIGWVLVIWFSFALYHNITCLANPESLPYDVSERYGNVDQTRNRFFQQVAASCGFMGLGIYLILLGKKRS